ncbi:hypothetical protein ACFWGN_11965 [Oerskovia sp. NPDC060338]|uniref:hypothetical protein n=1 Tax=Oerskovia sp. NPDC060338 TaxID=3347100 RepID=UPI00364E5D09
MAQYATNATTADPFILPATGLALTTHALESAIARDVNLAEMTACVNDAEQSWSSSKYGPDRVVFQRGDIAVVVSSREHLVVTVLFREQDQWTNSDGRPSGKRLSKGQRRKMTALLARLRDRPLLMSGPATI